MILLNGLLNSRWVGKDRDIVSYHQYEFHSYNFRSEWAMGRYRSRYNNNLHCYNEKLFNYNTKNIKAN